MRQRYRKRVKIYIVMIAAVILFFCISCGISWRRLEQAAAHADSLVNEKEQLQLDIRDLTREFDYMYTDEYIIRFAREELKLIMPGEYRYTEK